MTDYRTSGWVYTYGGVGGPTYTYDPTKYELVERGEWARLVNELADLRGKVAERGWDDQRNVTIPEWEYQDLKDRLEDANKLLMKKDARIQELEEEIAGMEEKDNTKWVYLENVILSLLQASERMREVGKEIKNSRGLR